jgi:hypothetical protein
VRVLESGDACERVSSRARSRRFRVSKIKQTKVAFQNSRLAPLPGLPYTRTDNNNCRHSNECLTAISMRFLRHKWLVNRMDTAVKRALIDIFIICDTVRPHPQPRLCKMRWRKKGANLLLPQEREQGEGVSLVSESAVMSYGNLNRQISPASCLYTVHQQFTCTNIFLRRYRSRSR